MLLSDIYLLGVCLHTSGFLPYISYKERNDPDVALPSLGSGAGQVCGHGKGVYGHVTLVSMRGQI